MSHHKDHHHDPAERLAYIEREAARLISEGENTMTDLTKLQAQVSRNTAAVKNLQDFIASSGDAATQSTVDALTNTLSTNNTALENVVPAPAPVPGAPPLR